MRSCLLLTLILAATPATAQSIDPAYALPTTCRALSYVPADARIDTPALAAKVSSAMCGVGPQMDQLTLRDDCGSRAALERAAAPAFAALDEAARSNQPEWQIVAEHLRGELYVAMTVRMRNAIPSLARKNGPALVELTQRHDALELQLTSWRDSSTAAFEAVRRIAAAHPEATRDPVAAYAVRDSTLPIVAAR